MKLDMDFIEVSKEEVRPPPFFFFVSHVQQFFGDFPFKGFSYSPNFLSEGETEEIMKEIDKGDWVPDLEGKRVQIFG